MWSGLQSALQNDDPSWLEAIGNLARYSSGGHARGKCFVAKGAAARGYETAPSLFGSSSSRPEKRGVMRRE